jgi:hypothetical protein
MRCPSKKAPCGSMSCWFIYTPHHLYSILYIKVTIRGTLPIIVWDSNYGLVSFRICTWVPCMTYVYFNGHDALKCYFEQNDIDYSDYKNSIVDLGLWDKIPLFPPFKK